MSAPTLPLVRHLSRPLTPWIAATPATPNLVTGLSLLLGLAAGAVLLFPGRGAGLASGILMVLCYVLDNCDGELARRKGMSSRFGMQLDTFSDWLVHTAFFAALGEGHAALTSERAWAWAGWAAAAGSSVNYVVGLALDRREPDDILAREGGQARPGSTGEWLLFAFRELARADFCFIVLALGLLDALWLLLPAAAVGAQAYWMTRFAGAAGRFRV